MKVTLLKDVLTPKNGVGRIGQTVEMTDVLAKEYLRKGLATEAAADAQALAPDEEPAPAKTLTRDTLNENADAEKRIKKPAPGPDETK